MKVLNYEMYRDGGTEEITTDVGVFCYDHRIESITAGCLYNGYPKEDNSNIIQDPTDIEQELLEALKQYTAHPMYQGHIDRLLLIKGKY